MKKGLIVAVIVGMMTLFIAVGIHAGTAVKDEVEMNNPAYKVDKYLPAKFTHKLHTEDYAKKYPDIYKSGCGECHHNDKGEPLKDLKIGDDVQNCIACHKKAERPKGIAKKKMKEKLEYHPEAIHENCKGCHKKVNKIAKKAGKKKKVAPTSCTKCHKKRKKK